MEILLGIFIGFITGFITGAMSPKHITIRCRKRAFRGE